MTTRIESILADARITLADKDGQRWSDDDLLRLLNEAHKDFATETQLLAGRTSIPVIVGDPYFTLPDDVWMITRVLWGTTLLPIISHTELDSQATMYSLQDFDISASSSWEADTGQPEAFLYDRRNMGEGKLYPIPDESIISSEYTFSDRYLDYFEDINNSIFGIYVGDDSTDTVYGVAAESTTGDFEDVFEPDYGVYDSSDYTVGVNGAGDIFDGNGSLGVIVGIDNFSLSSDFGVVVDMYDPSIQKEYFSSDYGVIGSIAENTGLIYVYYVKVPSDIVDTDSSLDTHSMWDKALKYYVVGHAFLNDLDEEYQAKGAQQLQLYERELMKARSTERRDSTRAGQMSTGYRSAF